MLAKTKILLHFRLLQFKRLIDSVGYLLIFVFLLCIVGILASIFSKVIDVSSWWSLFAAVLLCYSVIQYRNDKNFLLSIFHDKMRLSFYYFVENLLLIFPLLAFQFWFSHFLIVLSLIGIAILMAVAATFFSESFVTNYKVSFGWIPLRYFELKFAVESRPYTSALIYSIGLLSLAHIGFYILWAFILINCIIMVFLPIESMPMIHWKTKFVANKILDYSKVMLIATVPFFVLALVKNIDKWPLILYIIFCIWNTVFMAISLKYANYNPLHAKRMVNSIESIMMLLMFLPGGAIVVFGFNIYNYFLAEKNLKSYYA
jgi:hypothetical protein